METAPRPQHPWHKHGRLFLPDGTLPWSRSYALIPTPVVASDGVARVYYSTLDDRMRGSVGYFDVEASPSPKVVFSSKEPCLTPGPIGLFDDSGVNASSVVEWNGETLLYYIGWQRAEMVPYLLFSGVASKGAGASGPFVRKQPTPVLDRIASEPYIRSAPFVLNLGGYLRAWYVCGEGWIHLEGRQYPRYGVRTAISSDGISWRDSSPAIRLEGEDEFGIGRPYVFKLNQNFHMWYSVRSISQPYRLGYAWSKDGVTWTRRDDLVGLNRSEAGWDGEMVCYPAVFASGSRLWMLYNGNRHGLSGIGIASMRIEDLLF